MSNGAFWKIPKDIIKYDFSKSKIIILSEVMHLSYKTGYAYPKNAYLSSISGCSIKNCQRILSELVEDGWIEISLKNGVRHIKPKEKSFFLYDIKKPQKPKKRRDKRAQPNIEWLDGYIENMEKDEDAKTVKSDFDILMDNAIDELGLDYIKGDDDMKKIEDLMKEPDFQKRHGYKDFKRLKDGE